MNAQLIFFGLVFVAVLLLSQMLFVSVYNPRRANTKELKRQLAALSQNEHLPQVQLFVNNRLNDLAPWRAQLESIPLVKATSEKLELGGSKILGHEYLGMATVTAVSSGFLTWIWLKDPLMAAVTIGLCIGFFHLRLGQKMDKRMIAIETQFPEALDVLKRGLQAGYAFSDAIRLVFEELQGELSDEFKLLFRRINYGSDLKTALLYFVRRVPSTSAIAFSSAVNIQKETGGNLAENIDKLSKVIRQRFQFKRRVRTLSAEGRLSGWILVLLPFALFALLYITSPDYASELVNSESGHELLQYGLVGMVAGVIWIKKLLNIEV